MMFCYTSLETSFCNWLPVFGKEVISRAKADSGTAAVDASAQRLLSLFAVAMMAGRLGGQPDSGDYDLWVLVYHGRVGGGRRDDGLMSGQERRAGAGNGAGGWPGLAPISPTIAGSTLAISNPMSMVASSASSS